MKNLFILTVIILISYHSDAQSTDYAYLGVQSNQIEPEKAVKLSFDVPHGAYITSIIPNTAAEEGGLKVFDYIYRIGEYDLTEDMSLGKVMKLYKDGDQVTLYHYRDGVKMTSDVILGSSEDNTSYHRPDDEDPFLGVSQTHDNNVKTDGVLVNVVSNSTAEEIGMEDGDIITKIDDAMILDWHDLSAAINNRSAGDRISVTVMRNDQTMTFSGPIKPESSGHDSDWSWDSDWDWKWTWDEEKVAEDIEMSEMETEVSVMDIDEIKTAMEETGLDMPTENNLSIEEVNVFPNPSAGMFTLKFDLPKSGSTQINIFSSTGQLVLRRNLGQYQGNYTENLDIAGAGPGFYYLMIQQDDLAITRKIVISRN